MTAPSSRTPQPKQTQSSEQIAVVQRGLLADVALAWGEGDSLKARLAWPASVEVWG